MSFHDYENRRNPYSAPGSKYGWNGGGGSSGAGWVLAILVAGIVVLLLVVGLSGVEQTSTGSPTDAAAPTLEAVPEAPVDPMATIGEDTPAAPAN